MKNSQLDDIAIFVEVAQLGGFRNAAQKLNLGPATVSEAINRLENRIEIRLFERTTRKIALTEAGKLLLEKSAMAIQSLRAATNDLKNREKEISGILRLSAPVTSGPIFLDQTIKEFCKKHPEVMIDLTYEDSKCDLVTSGVDAAIRSNALLDPDTYAVPVGPKLKMVIVGAPNYFEKYGIPTKPDDIVSHNGLCFAFSGHNNIAPWSFTDNGLTLIKMPKTYISANSVSSLIDFAVNGMGITYVYKSLAESFIASGHLTPVLEEYLTPVSKYSINYLTKRHMPAKLRAFIDFAKTP